MPLQVACFSAPLFGCPLLSFTLTSIENEKPDKTNSGSSEEKLLNLVMRLEGTDQYSRSNKVTVDDVIHKYTTGSALPFLCGLGIIMVLCFIFVISPFKELLSASAIAGTTQSVLQFLVNIVLALLGGGLFGAIIYAIFMFFDLNILGIIIGIIGGLCLGGSIFTKYHPVITTSSLMGAGNVIHNIVIWILQIVIILLVLCLVWLIIVHTPLINVFYKPNNDKVLSDLKKYENYFLNHKTEFIALFNIDEAMSYACEYRLTHDLEQKNNAIRSIDKESGYIEIENKSQEELTDLEKRRDAERIKEKRIKQENAEKYQSIKRELEQTEQARVLAVQKTMRLLESDAEEKKKILETHIRKTTGFTYFNYNVSPIDIVKTFLEKKETNEKELIKQSEADKNYLTNLTEKFNRNMNFEKVDCTCSVYKTNAKLSEFVYFVKPKNDKNNMAVINKMQLKCMPIIGLYDYKDLQGDNLSDELSHFIEWLCVSVRRVTAQSIMGGITVIDTVSGNSVLKTGRFHGFLTVKDDSAGINSLTAQLIEKERMMADRAQSIQSQVKEMGLEKQIGDLGNIDALNKAIMLIDQDEILEDPNKPVEGEDGLWEQPVKYSFVIFIIPSANQKSAGQSVLTEELKKCLTSCTREGIIPIFLVDSDNWEHPEMSDDISWIRGLREKMMWRIANVGKDRRELLEITAI